jgi:hypothetical protein
LPPGNARRWAILRDVGAGILGPDLEKSNTVELCAAVGSACSLSLLAGILAGNFHICDPIWRLPVSVRPPIPVRYTKFPAREGQGIFLKSEANLSWGAGNFFGGAGNRPMTFHTGRPASATVLTSWPFMGQCLSSDARIFYFNYLRCPMKLADLSKRKVSRGALRVRCTA